MLSDKQLGDNVQHIITFYRNGLVLGVTPWTQGLDAAIQHAKNFITTRNATKVEVVEDDPNQSVVFTLTGKLHA